MLESMQEMMIQLGSSKWLMVAIVLTLIWSYAWKLFALWTAARKKAWVWFVILALVNTVGILEILYIFVFSKMKTPEPEKSVGAKPKRKKK